MSLAIPTAPLEQFKLFIDRIKPENPDHTLRISVLPPKGTANEWWTGDENRKTFYWNAERERAWARQWWLDWNSKQPTLCDAKGEIKKAGWLDIFRYLSIYNRNGYGIYIQPNPCLVGESGQTHALPGRAIFIESDGAIPANNAESKAFTQELAQQAQALDPDLIVTTFKSAHTYRISSRLYSSTGAWQVAQTRFTQAARGVWGDEVDESLTDANQLMRLPGFNHARWQDGRMQFCPVQIVFDSGKQHETIDADLPELEAPIKQKTEGEAHTATPFELSSFAHLLDHFKENGRKGYHTCQCPAHAKPGTKQSTDSLHINIETHQYKCQAECDTNSVYKAALEKAIAKGYQLPERKQVREHWDYEEPCTGVWGKVAAQFDKPVFFKDDAPELLCLLSPTLSSKILAAKEKSSPQAIALKAYAQFLERAGHGGYIDDAKELINGAWDWEQIPAKTPLWGWKGFLNNVRTHAGTETKKALTQCKKDIAAAAAADEAAHTRALADAWEMIPEGVEWLDTQYFGDALLNRVKAAGRDRLALGVFGATGAGKTYSLKEVRRYAAQEGRQLIYITAKEALARSTGRELGLEYRLDLESSASEERYPDIAACLAALIENARGINWESQVSPQAIIAIDEDDLVFAITAGTNAGENALEIQRVLRRMLRQAQTVVVISAQHKSRHQRLVERVGCFNRSEMIGILKAATPKQITICDDTVQPDSEAEVEGGDDKEEKPKGSLKNMMIDLLKGDLEEGKNALVLTGSQKPDSKLGTMLLEQFALEECGASSVLRLDSQSTKDPGNSGFKIADKDYIAAMRAVQLVVASPSCQEGFSLKFSDRPDGSHFSSVYCFDPGSKLPEQIIQDVGRDRHSTKTWISVAPGHTQKRFGGTVDAADVKRQLQAIANQAETKLLKTATFSSPYEWDNDYLDFYCEDVAQANAALADKIYNLERYLKEIGHSVVVLKPTPQLTGDGISEAFYKKVAHQFHSDVANAAHITRFDAEELQQKGQVTLEQWYQIQQLLFRQSMRWELAHTYNAQTDSIEAPENACDNGLELDPNWVRQWSRDRVAKPWQMHFYGQQQEWDWFAHDFKKARFAPKYENSKLDKKGNVELTEEFTPGQILGLKSRRLSILKELGILDFLNRWSVDTASDSVTSATSTKELAKTIHQEHKFNRFTKRDLAPIVEKLAPRFESVCELLGVKSQRNEDGGVNHRQVLTIVRNIFQVKTFAITNASLNGDRGVYVLVSDDRAQALRKGLLKADKAADVARLEQVEKARDLYNNTHNRTEIYNVWQQHLAVERKQFRDFLSEKSYQINLLDKDRPSHWRSLPDYLEPFEKAAKVCETPQEKVEPDTHSEPTEAIASNQTPLNEQETILLFRLIYCQSAEEYERVRADLETHSSDFDGRYWARIPQESQQRIYSYYQAVSV